MVYADTDFFLALLKERDWLKDKALNLLNEHKGEITTSITTFIELMLLCKKFALDPVKVTLAVMEITRYFDERVLKAAVLISQGMGVFDAFHAAYSSGSIISSDHVFDEYGFERVKLEDP